MLCYAMLIKVIQFILHVMLSNSHTVSIPSVSICSTSLILSPCLLGLARKGREREKKKKIKQLMLSA